MKRVHSAFKVTTNVNTFNPWENVYYSRWYISASETAMET